MNEFSLSKKIIFINDFRILANIGLFAEERSKKQELIFNLEIKANNYINNSVICKQIKNQIINHFLENKYKLLERAAFAMVKDIFDNFSNIFAINIKIKKPGALEKADASFVRLSIKK